MRVNGKVGESALIQTCVVLKFLVFIGMIREYVNMLLLGIKTVHIVLNLVSLTVVQIPFPIAQNRSIHR